MSSSTNPLDQASHHLTTSMSPTQIAMAAEQNPSSYAMSQPNFLPQHSYHPAGYQAATAAQQPPMPISPTNPRKRRLSDESGPNAMAIPLAASSASSSLYNKQQAQDHELLRQLEFDTSMAPQQQQQQQHHHHHQGPDSSPHVPAAKKSRVNTPWTPAEEQRLKQLRDLGQSWSEIAKSFPNRTEGSVKKHWYKDMHYAEFAQNESAALLHAIREYESSKWKVIGTKVGKPAKACEQYAREHFTKDQIAGKVKPEISGKESSEGKEM